MALATKLQELRLRSRKSLQDVADAVGASKQHIWDLEKGNSKNPSIELLTELAKCFKVSVRELIGENPEGEADEQVVAMYRDLKSLSNKDRDAIRVMIDRLKDKD